MTYLCLISFAVVLLLTHAADYSVVIDVQTGFETTTTVNLLEAESVGAIVQNFTVLYTMPDNHIECDNPRVTLIYEETDFYDYSGKNQEWVSVSYNDVSLSGRCVSGNEANCGIYATCIDEYTLSTNGLSAIATGSSLSLLVQLGAEVSDLCSHPYALNANLTLTCTGASSGVYEAEVEVAINTETSKTVTVQELSSPTNSEENYDVTFTIEDGTTDCFDPKITFVYEEIDFMDYSGNNNEWVAISYNGATLGSQCVAGVDGNCGVFDTCLDEFELSTVGVDSITAGSSITLSVDVGMHVDSLCSSSGNPYALNGDLTLICFGHSGEYYAEVNPIPFQDVSRTMFIEEYASPANEEQIFTLEFKVPSTGNVCNEPTITFIFEEIDYNWGSEFLQLDYDGSTLATCTGGQYGCGSYIDCLRDVSLGVTSLSPGESAEFTLTVGSGVDALCGDNRAVSANLTITCAAYVAYSAVVSTDPRQPTTTTISILEDASTTNQEQIFLADFELPSTANVCHDPVITFKFEEIDYNSANEFLILEYDNVALATCTGAQYGCGSFAYCLNRTAFGEPALFPGETARFKLTVGYAVDSLCNDNRAVQADLTLTCKAAPEYSTLIPPGSSRVAEVLVQELPSPTNSIESVDIKFLNPPSAPACTNPTLSMQYLEIDFSYSLEYLTVKHDGNDLITCGVNGLDAQCTTWLDCLTNQALLVPGGAILPGQSVELTLVTGGYVDALCSGIPYAVVANFSLTCSTGSSAHVVPHMIDHAKVQNRPIPKKINHPSDVVNNNKPIKKVRHPSDIVDNEPKNVVNPPEDVVDNPTSFDWNSSTLMEFIGMNIVVSIVVSLCSVSALLTCWYMCCFGCCRRNSYGMVHKIDSMEI